MPSSPPPPDPRHRLPVKVAVLLGPASGAAPTINDRCDYLRPISLTRDFGGGTLDSITLDFDLSRYGSRLQDTSLPTGHNRIVEIRTENPLTGLLDQCRGWGKLARQPQSIGSGETVGFVARLDHFLFGNRLVGYPVYDPLTSAETVVRNGITANPVIDDTRQPNRSDKVGAHGQRLFIDPESLRTGGAKLLQNATTSFWDLATLTQTICWLLNPSETWFKNPALVDLQNTMGIGTPLLRDHDLPLGCSLPEALDALLAPHGYTWFVKHTIDTGDAALPRTSRIVVAERGAGLPVTLLLQRLEDTIDSGKTNIDTLSIAYDIAARPNVIQGRSALMLREGTFPLRPAWSKTDDVLTKADLTEERKEKDREHIDVHSKFVFDTDGSYTGTRDDFPAVNDLEPLFGTTTVPMRRRFKPALTQGLDRKPLGENGFLLEWNTGTEWKQISTGFSVLEHECGIRLERGIDEDFRQAFLAAQRAVATGSQPAAILRITCCIQGDDCFEFTATRRTQSANGSDIPRLYDLSHKFKDSRVANSGPFASILYANRHKTINAATAKVAGDPDDSVSVSGDLTGTLAEGDRVAIIDSTENDGVYHVESVATLLGTSSIVLREPLAGAIGDGTLAYLTDEEKPDTPMQAYCEEIQLDEDFVVIHADATLFGIDHPEYELGQIITKIEQRNLSLDSYSVAAVAQRHPQITRMTYQFNGEQKLSLTLDQFDRTGGRRFQRLRTR